MGLLTGIPRSIRWILLVTGLILLFITIYRFFFFYHYRLPGRPFTGSAFLLGLRYDLRVVFILGVSMFLITAIPFLDPFRNKRVIKVWPALLTVVFLVLMIFYAADFYHYDYLRSRLNATVLNFAEDAAISYDMMMETYPVITLGIIIVSLLVLWYFAMVKLLRWVQQQELVRIKGLKVGAHIAYFLIGGLFIFGRLGQYPLRWSEAYRFGDEFKASVALNPFQSFFSTLKFKNSGYDLAKVRRTYPLIADYLGVVEKDSVGLNFSRYVNYTDTFINKPNIVLVLCESFSSYKSSMHGNPLDPSPYFKSLAAQGTYFDRCFSPAIGTARGVWATITGIPDVESPKTASRNPLAVDQHSIINDFQSHNKFYFLGGSTTWANIRGVLTNNLTGLKIYEGEHFKAEKEDVWGISDKNLFLESNKILSEQSKPFFAIIQTANNHRPYTIPDEDLKEFKKLSLPKDTLQKYGFESNEEFNASRYMDYCIKKFMEAAEKEPYFSNTIFAFIGDHGIRGNAGDMLPLAYTKHGLVAEHVPLLFYSKRYVKPQRLNRTCSQLDVIPALAAIAKQPHLNTTLGVNIMDSLQKPNFAFIADPELNTTGLISNQYYFVRNKGGNSEMVSMIDNLPVVKNMQTDSAKRYMERMTEGFFETSRYMLLNNKKPNQPAQ